MHVSCLKELPKAELAPACEKLGREWEPYLFDYRGIEWSTFLGLLTFESSKPELDFEKLMEFRDRNLEWECESHDPELDDFADTIRCRLAKRRDLSQAEINELVETAKESAQAWGLENAIWSGIRCINSKLALWIPVCNEDGIPQEGVSGCSTKDPCWAQFERFFRKHFLPSQIREDAKEDWKNPDFWLNTFEVNASYGGEAGFAVFLDGSEIIDWRNAKDLPTFLRSLGQVTAEVGVITFGNGAGHAERLPLDLSNYRAPSDDRRAGIINNMLDSVFGLVGLSSVDYGEGVRWTTNIWFPLKPVVEHQSQAA